MLDLAIPNSGPLITFGLLNKLDLLDRFKCAILVTDMVLEEVLRGPDTAKDKVIFEKWFGEQGNGIFIRSTQPMELCGKNLLLTHESG